MIQIVMILDAQSIRNEIMRLVVLPYNYEERVWTYRGLYCNRSEDSHLEYKEAFGIFKYKKLIEGPFEDEKKAKRRCYYLNSKLKGTSNGK